MNIVSIYYLYLAWLFVGLDVLTTLYGLWEKKNIKESNGIVVYLMHRVGTFTALAGSHVLVGAGFWMMYKFGLMNPYGFVATAVYAFAVVSNVLLILTGKSLLDRILQL